MSRTRISQQTSPIRLTRRLGVSQAFTQGTPTVQEDVHGTLQWLLDGPGWTVLRPAVDFALLCVAVIVALGGAPTVTTGVPSADAPVLAMPVLITGSLLARGLYGSHRRLPMLDGVAPVVSVVSVAAMLAAAIGLIVGNEPPSGSAWIGAWLLSLTAIATGHLVTGLVQSVARRRRLVGRPVLIMGAGLIGSQVARRLEKHPEYGLVPIGFIDEDPRPEMEVGGREIPVLGTLDDLDEIAKRTNVKNLIVAFSTAADAKVNLMIRRCHELGMEVSVVPRMFDTINHRVGYDAIGGLPLLSFARVNPKGVRFAIKDAVDRVGAAALLIVLSPLLALVALAVWLSSPGPILFRQRRVGRDGVEFDLYKFRSMRLTPGVSANGTAAARAGYENVEQLIPRDVAPGGVEGPDRRTTVGRILRRTSLDELPQLINVLRGDMSLIGPRPERPEFVELFARDVGRYEDRHRVKSGITGWAQVHGLRGNTSLAERVEWDNYYITHWSLGLDLKIALLTVLALIHSGD